MADIDFICRQRCKKTKGADPEAKYGSTGDPRNERQGWHAYGFLLAVILKNL